MSRSAAIQSRASSTGSPPRRVRSSWRALPCPATAGARTPCNSWKEVRIFAPLRASPPRSTRRAAALDMHPRVLVLEETVGAHQIVKVAIRPRQLRIADQMHRASVLGPDHGVADVCHVEPFSGASVIRAEDFPGILVIGARI